ncbi:alpha/beta fold hydrolase [Nocardioides sambongensis]|uniref:alpha/beta fold hydrolase n=1 Tax=Nocardioides sambongensis TaxID=2589074 RepID=UPI001126DD3C|nr:alpha/beta hydrolase [Nocardioides sambongensis]
MDTLVTDLTRVRLTSLTWGDPTDADRPLALLLHGFPDTAHTWRHLGPALAEAGYRAVAPFTRGYAPSTLATDGVYHPAALMSDALALHQRLRGDARAVVVGHDWGAITANGVAALPSNPFGRVVSMAVPPIPALRARPGDAWGLLPRQAAMSWYTLFNQLPVLPERRAERLVAHLWRRWSPGYDAGEDLEHLRASLPPGAHRTAAFGYYRDALRRRTLPAPYDSCAEHWLAAPRGPLLYLHGEDDGCCDVRWAARAEAALPSSAQVAVVAGAGHFLQLERPEIVNARVLEFLSRSAPAEPVRSDSASSEAGDER